MPAFKKGYTPWNKGKRLSSDYKLKLSLAGMGKKLSPEIRAKISQSKKGTKIGVESHTWKGGVYQLSRKIRASYEYRVWRQSILIRDGFICQSCGKIGENLEVHHIKTMPKLIAEAKKYMPLYNEFSAAMMYGPMWDVKNGVTLCHDCHVQTDNYGKQNFIKATSLRKG